MPNVFDLNRFAYYKLPPPALSTQPPQKSEAAGSVSEQTFFKSIKDEIEHSVLTESQSRKLGMDGVVEVTNVVRPRNTKKSDIVIYTRRHGKIGVSYKSSSKVRCFQGYSTIQTLTSIFGKVNLAKISEKVAIKTSKLAKSNENKLFVGSTFFVNILPNSSTKLGKTMLKLDEIITVSPDIISKIVYGLDDDCKILFNGKYTNFDNMLDKGVKKNSNEMRSLGPRLVLEVVTCNLNLDITKYKNELNKIFLNQANLFFEIFGCKQLLFTTSLTQPNSINIASTKILVNSQTVNRLNGYKKTNKYVRVKNRGVPFTLRNIRVGVNTKPVQNFFLISVWEPITQKSNNTFENNKNLLEFGVFKPFYQSEIKTHRNALEKFKIKTFR